MAWRVGEGGRPGRKPWQRLGERDGLPDQPQTSEVLPRALSRTVAHGEWFRFCFRVILHNRRSLSATAHNSSFEQRPGMVTGAPAMDGLPRERGEVEQRAFLGVPPRSEAGRHEAQPRRPGGAVRACSGTRRRRGRRRVSGAEATKGNTF